MGFQSISSSRPWRASGLCSASLLSPDPRGPAGYGALPFSGRARSSGLPLLSPDDRANVLKRLLATDSKPRCRDLARVWSNKCVAESPGAVRQLSPSAPRQVAAVTARLMISFMIFVVPP